MTIVDASKSPVSIQVLNEKTCFETWKVSLPSELSARKRKAAEDILFQAGFKNDYEFAKKVVDRRSVTLAKAQAASLAKRIENKTGQRMEVIHSIEITG